MPKGVDRYHPLASIPIPIGEYEDLKAEVEQLRRELEEAKRQIIRVSPAGKACGDAYRSWKDEQR